MKTWGVLAGILIAGWCRAEDAAFKEKEPAGVAGVSFGASKREALDRLARDRSPARAVGEDVVVPDFSIAGIRYDLRLAFGKRDRLYSYSLSSEGVTKDFFQSALQEDAETLSRIFTGKFGDPADSFSPLVFDVKPGYDAPFRKWRGDRFDARVGLSVQGDVYRARGVVVDRTLAAAEGSSDEARSF